MSMKDVRSNMDGGSGLAAALRNAGYHHFAAAVEAGQKPAPNPAPASTTVNPSQTGAQWGVDLSKGGARPMDESESAEGLDRATRREGDLGKKKQLEAKRQSAYDAEQPGAKGTPPQDDEEKNADR